MTSVTGFVWATKRRRPRSTRSRPHVPLATRWARRSAAAWSVRPTSPLFERRRGRRESRCDRTADRPRACQRAGGVRPRRRPTAPARTVDDAGHVDGGDSPVGRSTRRRHRARTQQFGAPRDRAYGGIRDRRRRAPLRAVRARLGRPTRNGDGSGKTGRFSRTAHGTRGTPEGDQTWLTRTGDGGGRGNASNSAATSPSIASASVRCASRVTACGVIHPTVTGSGGAPPSGRARRELHRHRRLLRSRRE